MRGAGQATLKWILSGLLAFSLFGFVGMGYAEPAAPATDGEAAGAAEGADASEDIEVPVLEPVDSPEPVAPDTSDAEAAPSDEADAPAPDEEAPGEEEAPVEDEAVGAPDAETALSKSVESAAAMLFSLAAPTNEVLATDAPSYAQPGPDDFEFSNGAIRQLKKSYVDGLTSEQKQDVRLIMPAEIGGQAVTEIAESAFYSYNKINAGLTFTSLDFSQATSLQTIGSNAFRYARSLTGDLAIPDSVTTLGENVFADCGFTGSLHLPHNAAFEVVPGQAFLETKFSGTLEIPANVKVIQRKAFEGTGFSGALVIPEGVEELWASAFKSCSSITSASIPSTLDFKKRDGDSGHHFRNCSSLQEITFTQGSCATSLYSEMFGGCTSLRVLELPDSIVNIDAKAFYSCGLKTVFLPAAATITANAESFFSSCPGAVAVCKDKASYDSYKAQFPSAQQKLLSYPITVSFDAGSYGTNPSAVTRLHDRPLNMVKDEATKIWAVDEGYALPVPGGMAQPPTGSWFAWSFDAGGSNPATETTGTGTEGDVVLHGQGVKVADPTISFDFPSRVGKVYDGEDMELTVTAKHPLAVDPSSVKAGDYVFAYRWMLYDRSTGTTAVKQQGFDNTFRLRDVADSQTGPVNWYLVYVYFYHVADPSNVSDIFSSSNKVKSFSFYVQIQPAAPSVHPALSLGEGNLPGFPALSVSDGDTPGSVAWDAGQTLVDGTHAYAWTFTPDPPAAGKPANYTTATGAMDLRAANGKVVQRVAFDTAGGSALDPIDVPYATALPAKALPVRDGYVFLGWYQDAECTQPWSMAAPVLADMELHAQWEQRAASVDPGEGDVVVNGQPIDQESHTLDIVHKPEVAPEHQDALGSIDLPAGSEPAAFFDLKLVMDGVEVEDATFDRGLSVTVSYQVEDGVLYRIAHMKHDGTIELLDARPDVAAQTLSFTVTSLSPFMVIQQRLCRVTFDARGGSAVAPLVGVPAGTRIAAPKDPVRAGYRFVGWCTDAAGKNAWDFSNGTVTANMTLFAVWKAEGQNPIPGRPELTTPPAGNPNDIGGNLVPVDSNGKNGSGPAAKTRTAAPPASGTGDGALTLPMLGLAIAVAALALCTHRARRRMR